MTKVTIGNQYEVAYALSIGAKNQWPWMTLKIIMDSVSKRVCRGVVINLFLVSHSICFPAINWL